MGFMESFFGKKTEPDGRQNDGGDFMAVPGPDNGQTEEKGFEAVEQKRLRKEELENKIVEIEGDPNHPEKDKLEEYRNRLRELQ